jgi:tetratricopeptide (TPR) repeat protein
MQDKYRGCSKQEKALLRSVKRLYQARVYCGREVFDSEKIHDVAGRFEELSLKKHEWTALEDELVTKGFVQRSKEGLHVEEAYLPNIVKGDFLDLADLNGLADLFADDPSALFSIELAAYDRSLVDLKKRDYLKLAIKCLTEVLKQVKADSDKEFLAMTQNNLGNAYQSLGDVEDKASNCRFAIEAFREALKVRTYEAFPMDYAMTQNNLGVAYRNLGDVEDKAPNCRLAIDAYKEALRVNTYEAFPMDYAMTQNNLGLAYQSLGDVEDKAPNCRLAIEAYGEALRVYTYEAFPMQYAMTQNNLGLAYWTFAEAADKAGNCAKARTALEEALRVYREQKMPMQVEMALGNLERLAAFCEGGDSSLRS